MESPGTYLKQARERRGIALSEIARVTKINERQLEALEADAFDRLPSPIFVKGFIQAYARAVGLDPEAAVRHYVAYCQAQQAAVVQAAPSASRPPIWERKPLVWGALVVALVLYLVAVSTLDLFPRRARQPAPPPPVARTPVPPSGPSPPAGPAGAVVPPVTPGAPADVTGLEPEPSASGSPPGSASEPPGGSNAAGAGTAGAALPTPPAKVSLQARAVDRTWIWVQLDEREPQEVLLRPGQTARWEAEQRLVAIIGNAGGVEIQADGRELGKLGPPGKVVRLTLPEGLPPAPGSPTR